MNPGSARAVAYEENGIAFYNPTPPQKAWHQDPARAKLFRGANQVGKTRAQCAEVIWRCLGEHPYLETHQPPIEAWIICHSWEQSSDIQKKFHEIAPRRHLHSATEFVPGKGYRGKTPIVRFANGSIVRFKTSMQGTLGLASATVHYVGIDEPPPPEIWSELAARVFRHRGTIGLTLTPIGRPCEWLKELVESGEISDHVAPMTEENCTPQREPPFITEGQIREAGSIYLPWEVAQRLRGEWHGIATDRVFEAFSSTHIVAQIKPKGNAQIGIGIDHGSIGGSQIALLCAVTTDPKDRYPRIWVLDEATAKGTTTPEQDAGAILAMLGAHGMTYSSVDEWVGDRKHGGRRWGGSKSNALLATALERELGKGVGGLPFGIRTVRKGRNSVHEGVKILHAAMVRQHFWVDPRCVQLVESLRYWSGADDEHKHAIDALRYAVITTIKRGGWGPSKLRMY